MSETKTWKKDPYFLSTDKTLLQVDRIHRFLSTKGYWSLGIPKDIVKKAIAGSLCFGLFDRSKPDGLQIGFARVVTDEATFAWICDVYIEDSHRGLGLSKWLVESVMDQLNGLGLRRICLATKDAHSLYEKYGGFEVTKAPGNWLEIRKENAYLQGTSKK